MDKDRHSARQNQFKTIPLMRNEICPKCNFARFWVKHQLWRYIPAWKNKHMLSKVWDQITHPFPNINGTTIEIWEWISNFIPHFIMDAITKTRRCTAGYNHHTQIAQFWKISKTSFFWKGVTDIRVWINDYHHCFKWGVIIHAQLLLRRLVKHPLKMQWLGNYLSY